MSQQKYLCSSGIMPLNINQCPNYFSAWKIKVFISETKLLSKVLNSFNRLLELSGQSSFFIVHSCICLSVGLKTSKPSSLGKSCCKCRFSKCLMLLFFRWLQDSLCLTNCISTMDKDARTFFSIYKMVRHPQ